MLGERIGNNEALCAARAFQFGTAHRHRTARRRSRAIEARPSGDHSRPRVGGPGLRVMVTPVQLARGFCVYANGGRLVEPTISKACSMRTARLSREQATDAGNDAGGVDRAASRRCSASSRTSHSRHRPQARSEIYNIFGKTGTAHVSEGAGGYTNKYTSSFLAGRHRESADGGRDHHSRAGCGICQAHNMSYYGGAVAAPGATRLIDRRWPTSRCPHRRCCLPRRPRLPRCCMTITRIFMATNPHRRDLNYGGTPGLRNTFMSHLRPSVSIRSSI